MMTIMILYKFHQTIFNPYRVNRTHDQFNAYYHTSPFHQKTELQENQFLQLFIDSIIKPL